MKEKTTNILISGVGGQGIILASDIICDMAIASGLDVKKTDTIGMAQRGGSVVSNLRIAKKVWSPLIKVGDVDILLAFEKLEAARLGNYLSKNGIAIINDYAIPPLSVSLGNTTYPTNDEIKSIIAQRTKNVIFVKGTEKAIEIGDVRTLNTFMLGCVSNYMDIDLKVWQDCISKRLPPKILQINQQAFDAGTKETLNINIR